MRILLMNKVSMLIDSICIMMILLLILVSFVAPLLVGGLTGGPIMDHKIESGYMVLLRDAQGVWQEVNAVLYYAHVFRPWIFFSTIPFIACVTLFRNTKRKERL